jgi:putative membrane protein
MHSLFGLAIAAFSHMNWGMDWNDGGWFWMALMMIGGVILIVVVAFLLLKPYYGLRQGIPGGTGSPLDIAKRRYAAGEISAEEFEKIKQDISDSGS